MKKLLCTIATKMEPGIVQNIIGRLGSKTPRLFKLIQLYSAILIAALGAGLTAMSEGVIPPFNHEWIAIGGLKFLITLFIGIGGASTLPTTDLRYVSPEIIEKAMRETPAPEVKPTEAVMAGKQKDDPTPNTTDFPAIR